MTRRGCHFYAFRLDLAALGVGREVFARALAAEGVPARAGYSMPLYRNPVFQRKGTGPAYCPVSCPYHGRGVDYAATRCPVCEQVAIDTLWLMHPVLLSDAAAMREIVAAVRKVCDHVDELREQA